MLLYLSSRLEGGKAGGRPRQGCEHFPGDVALEAADDLPFAQAFCGPSREVGTGWGVVAQPDNGDHVERAVGCPVAAAAQSVAAGGPAAAGRLGSCPAELGEGSLAADAVGVVAGGDQELAGTLGGDPEEADELGRRLLDQSLDLAAECLDLLVQCLPAPGEVSEASLHASQEHPLRVPDHLDQVLGLRPQAQTSVHECPLAELHELVPKRRGSANHQTMKGEKGLCAGLHGTRTSYPENPDDLDGAGLRLRDACSCLGQDGSSHLLGIQAVGLCRQLGGRSG